MATTEILTETRAVPIATRSTAATNPLQLVLSALASLRLTVVLLALSIFLVFAGTLAQVDYDVWHVMDRMFRSWGAKIELQFFFLRSWKVPGWFPFPGGWLLGTALAVNLFAAHATRFKVTGRGRSLGAGWALIGAGALVTYAVIQSGLGQTVESQLSPRFCNGLWHALRAALGAVTLVFCYGLALPYQKSRQAAARWLWWMAAGVALLLVGLVIWLFTHPEARLDPAGLRIMWQLVKGTGAGIVLLAGCRLVFGHRGGIALLHAGIALLMFSELHTGLTAQEANMTIAEGQTVDYAEDMRSAELAIRVHGQDRGERRFTASGVARRQRETGDRIVVVPTWMLEEAQENNQIIEDEQLPIKLRVVEFYPNSHPLRQIQPGETTPATEGYGMLRQTSSKQIN